MNTRIIHRVLPAASAFALGAVVAASMFAGPPVAIADDGAVGRAGETASGTCLQIPAEPIVQNPSLSEHGLREYF